MDEQEAKAVIQAAANVLLDVVLRELQVDPHQWSDRPCSTCRSISGVIGKPFGCYLYAEQRKRR